MQLHNSLSRTLQPFAPAGDEVTLYACGITPYDTTHMGHAFTYTSTDVLIRYLEYLGYTVRYAQNVTDIDDDILKKAKEVGEDWKKLGDRWTAHFIRDMQELNVRPPDAYPRATDVIPEIVRTVQNLLESGVAYEAGGNVYFDLDAWPGYGKLSGLSREAMLPVANERGNFPDDPNKRHPLDFVLWQAQSPGEPAWDSPWGPGRPGWHIECSTMSTTILGPTIDIHGGGHDLIFPHHESEIAQVEPLTGGPFVRIWMHTAMVYQGEEKMSKSLGNLVMVRDVLRRWSPDALRLYLGRQHYRKPWSYDEAGLARAELSAAALRDAAGAFGGEGEPLDPEPHRSAFEAALDNDLDGAAAIDALERLAQDVRKAGQAGRSIESARQALVEWGRVFGLRLAADAPEERVTEGWEVHLRRFGQSESTAVEGSWDA